MKFITLTKDKKAIVDDEDYGQLSAFKWYCSGNNKDGYRARRSKDDKSMHRVILGLTNPKIVVDHINHNSLDNRRKNLRICSQGKNVKNRSKQHDNQSGFKGVYWDKQRSKWRANISVNNKTVYIGLFNDKLEAALAYDRAAQIHYGDFACLNFPKEILAENQPLTSSNKESEG